MKEFFLFCVVLSQCVFNVACSNGVKPMYYVDGDNALLSYSGRIDQSIKGQTSFSYSAVELNCAFSGTSIEVVLSDQSTSDQLNYIDVWLDGKYKGKVELARNSKTIITYNMSDFNNKQEHTLKLVKRTEAFVGKVIIHKIGVDGPEHVQKYIPSHAFNIEFIGNSITCGYGNEVSIPLPPKGNPSTGFHSENENAYMSYAGFTARNCNARPTYLSYSGKGMFQNHNGSKEYTMPLLYHRVHPDDAHSIQCNMSDPKPDIIVINLGTNDYAAEDRGVYLDDSAFAETYIHFIEKLTGLYPDAKIVCAGGAMMSDVWPDGRQALTRFKANIYKICAIQYAKGNNNIYPFFFTAQEASLGEDYHPTIASHKKMAEELTAFIKTLRVK